jgi:hypothetical protein
MAVLALAIAGSVGGVVFWLIRRPDRDAKLDAAPEHTDLSAHG